MGGGVASASAEPAAFAALLETIGVDATEVAEPSAAPTAALLMRHGSHRSALRRHRKQPFVVGREREQEQMRALLCELAAGRGCLLLLAGEAGIGKTTLTNWLGWAAEEQGEVRAGRDRNRRVEDNGKAVPCVCVDPGHGLLR